MQWRVGEILLNSGFLTLQIVIMSIPITPSLVNATQFKLCTDLGSPSTTRFFADSCYKHNCPRLFVGRLRRVFAGMRNLACHATHGSTSPYRMQGNNLRQLMLKAVSTCQTCLNALICIDLLCRSITFQRQCLRCCPRVDPQTYFDWFEDSGLTVPRESGMCCDTRIQEKIRKIAGQPNQCIECRFLNQLPSDISLLN